MDVFCESAALVEDEVEWLLTLDLQLTPSSESMEDVLFINPSISSDRSVLSLDAKERAESRAAADLLRSESISVDVASNEEDEDILVDADTLEELLLDTLLLLLTALDEENSDMAPQSFW